VAAAGLVFRGQVENGASCRGIFGRYVRVTVS
jgi:hypothetical protein